MTWWYIEGYIVKKLVYANYTWTNDDDDDDDYDDDDDDDGMTVVDWQTAETIWNADGNDDDNQLVIKEWFQWLVQICVGKPCQPEVVGDHRPREGENQETVTRYCISRLMIWSFKPFISECMVLFIIDVLIPRCAAFIGMDNRYRPGTFPPWKNHASRIIL